MVFGVLELFPPVRLPALFLHHIRTLFQVGMVLAEIPLIEKPIEILAGPASKQGEGYELPTVVGVIGKVFVQSRPEASSE